MLIGAGSVHCVIYLLFRLSKIILLKCDLIGTRCSSCNVEFVWFVDRGVASSVSKIEMVNEFISVVLCVLILDLLTS